jgi:hypothetical protein
VGVVPILAGAASASPSVVESATANGVTITVTAEPELARLAIVLTGGPAGEPVYVLRRQPGSPSTLVRPTSAGTLLWQAGSPTSVPTFYEYEARQGLETDFVVTDLDGSPLVSVRFTVPEWGTWLKSPGKPFLNLRCLWKQDSEYSLPIERVVLRPRGAKFPIVQSSRRASPSGPIALPTQTDEDARAMVSLLADGQVLMVDVPARFGIPLRYVSVGDASPSRAVGSITYEARVWTLDVVEVAAPIGLPAGQGFTYENVAALADSYIALAATFATYDDLAVGLEV